MTFSNTKQLLRDERGASLLEYLILVIVVAVAAAAAFGDLSAAVKEAVTSQGKELKKYSGAE